MEEKLKSETYELIRRAKMLARTAAEFEVLIAGIIERSISTAKRYIAGEKDYHLEPAHRVKLIDALREEYETQREQTFLFGGLDRLIPEAKVGPALLAAQQLNAKPAAMRNLAQQTKGHYLTMRPDVSNGEKMIVVSELRRPTAVSTDFISARGSGKRSIVIGGYLFPLANENIALVGGSQKHGLWSGLLKHEPIGSGHHLVGCLQCLSESGKQSMQAPFVVYRVAEDIDNKVSAYLRTRTGVYSRSEVAEEFRDRVQDIDTILQFLDREPFAPLDRWTNVLARPSKPPKK